MGEHSTHAKLTLGSLINRIILLTLGGVVVAYALESLLIPNDIIDGGVIGISMLLNHITPLGLSVFLVLLNLPFLLFRLQTDW